MTRDEALQLLNEMVSNENLKKHMYCVEAAMRAYAEKFGEDVGQWGLAGLLHDADWEKYPNDHPKIIVKKLETANIDSNIVAAIASHGNNSEEYGWDRFKKRERLIDKALFAVDELSGFVIACALVRPDKLDNLKASSVKKKLKDKSFAAQVNREDIYLGAEELGVELEEHINFVIDALQSVKTELGF